MNGKQFLTDDDLDEVVGGTAAQTAEITNYLKSHCGWDGKGTIKDALQKALGYNRGSSNYLKIEYYNTSDTEDNQFNYTEQRGSNIEFGGNHYCVMEMLKDKYGK